MSQNPKQTQIMGRPTSPVDRIVLVSTTTWFLGLQGYNGKLPQETVKFLIPAHATSCSSLNVHTKESERERKERDQADIILKVLTSLRRMSFSRAAPMIPMIAAMMMIIPTTRQSMAGDVTTSLISSYCCFSTAMATPTLSNRSPINCNEKKWKQTLDHHDSWALRICGKFAREQERTLAFSLKSSCKVSFLAVLPSEAVAPIIQCTRREMKADVHSSWVHFFLRSKYKKSNTEQNHGFCSMILSRNRIMIRFTMLSVMMPSNLKEAFLPGYWSTLIIVQQHWLTTGSIDWHLYCRV